MGVVVHAGERNKGAVAGIGRRRDLLDKVKPLPDAGDLAGGRERNRLGHGSSPGLSEVVAWAVSAPPDLLNPDSTSTGVGEQATHGR